LSVRDELGNLCDHRIRVHLFAVALPAVDVRTALRNAQRVYGHHRICLTVVSGQTLSLSAADQLTLNVVDGACSWNIVSDEQRLLHSLGNVGTMAPNDIRVYWVNEIRQPDGSALAGCAGHAAARPAVMVSAIGSLWTMAHELGHVLLGSTFNPVHVARATNIMYAPSASITAHLPTFDAPQLAAIRASQFCQRC
jgi:hypothetical protein